MATEFGIIQMIYPLLEDYDPVSVRYPTNLPYWSVPDSPTVVNSQTKYKTEKCRNFLSPEGCPFGDKCFFAHGLQDLRAKVVISSKYKTKPCLNFSRAGCCKYGDRCQFSHNVPAPVQLPKPTEIAPSSPKSEASAECGRYEKFLQEIAENGLLSDEKKAVWRRLKVFEAMQDDNEVERIDWKYKKSRTYSL